MSRPAIVAWPPAGGTGGRVPHRPGHTHCRPFGRGAARVQEDRVIDIIISRLDLGELSVAEDPFLGGRDE
jgi:hypothetical protein